MISAIILNYNDFSNTSAQIDRIINYQILDKIIVVDNCSTDDSFSKLLNLQSKKVIVIRSDKNGGYGYGNNVGIKYAIKNLKSKYAVVCNPDTEFTNESITQCYEFLHTHCDCALVAPVMLFPSGEVNYKCSWKIPTYFQALFFSLYFSSLLVKKMFYNKTEFKKDFIEIECSAGSLIFVDLQKILEAGLYDENIFLYCEETVLGILLQKHCYKSYLLTNVSFVHRHSESINKTYKSEVAKKKIMWNSRLYVLEKYYHIGCIKKMFAKFIAFVSITETRILTLVKRKTK